MHFTRHGAYADADAPVSVRGEGVYLYDSQGKRYLDALPGLFVSQLGHGREDLADPDPSPFIKFWLYTHPPLEDRIRFALSYKPWAEGKPFEFVHPRE